MEGLLSVHSATQEHRGAEGGEKRREESRDKEKEKGKEQEENREEEWMSLAYH